MLLVIESRADLMSLPAETAPRSTARALEHMGWPFPVDDAPAPRRPLPLRATNVVALRPAVPAPSPVEPRRSAARAALATSRFVPVLAEAH
jgi:hypothetical protein